MKIYGTFAKNKRGIAGFTIVEISLALIISALVAFAVFRTTINDSTKQGGTVQADQLLQIKLALENYVNVHGVALVSGTAVAGVAVPLQPTITELQTLQMLPGQFTSLATLNNSPFVTQLTVLPAGCTLGSCVVSGYAYIRDPILDTGNNTSIGEYDGVSVSAMLTRMGGDGFARVVANGNLVASGGAFSIPNSAAVAHPTITVGGQPYPAGIVGVRLVPKSPSAATSSGVATTAAGAPCPAGTINNVVATGTNGNGTGNQCFFNYPTIVLGSSATVSNTQISTIGSLTLFCLAINGNSTIQIANLTCLKK